MYTLQFFSAALDGATADPKFRTARFRQIRSSLREDSVANYESIWSSFRHLLDRDVNKAGSFKAKAKAISRPRPRPRPAEIKAKVEFNSYGL